MKKLIILFCLFPVLLQAQLRPVSISVFSNSEEGFKQPMAVFTQITPGVAIGTSYRYNDNKINQLGQNLKFSYFQVTGIHRTIMVYTEFTYKYALKNGLDLGPNIGIGYAHSFYKSENQRLNSNGVYEQQTNWGRPQIMPTTALEFGYTFKGDKKSRNQRTPRIFVNYQSWYLTPGFEQFSPLKENTSFHIGASYPMMPNKREGQKRTPHY